MMTRLKIRGEALSRVRGTNLNLWGTVIIFTLNRPGNVGARYHPKLDKLPLGFFKRIFIGA